MGVVGRLDQYASMLATEFDETTANGPSITGLGTYYASEFSENIVDIISNGLVLNLDAGNQSSLNIPTQADHGYADWYCLVSGTATYSIVNSIGGFIYENNGGSITTLVTATGPQRGTISVTAGRTYYGSVPINLVVEDQQHSIVPLTMMGTQFWSIVVRNNPSTYYVYSPYQAATVNFYDNTTGGLTGTPTSTLSLSAGQSGTFTSNNLTNHWISSNIPILASTTQTGWDKTILSPMSTYVYQRFINNYGTTNFTTPTTIATNVIYDSTYKVMAMSIADGSGGDCAQGLGLEYLSDTYSWGNVLSDYVIVAPYAATVITTSYWSGSAWVVWDTHNLSGTITSPAQVSRDGTQGPGVTATVINGGATNMASGATLWKWEGNNPFYLCINDSVDDEFSVLGWTQARTTSPRSGTTWNDLSGNGNNGTLINGPTYSSANGGSIVFDGVDDYISIPNFSYRFNTSFTISVWIKFISLTAPNTLVSNYSQVPNDGVFLESTAGNQLRFVYRNAGVNVFDFSSGAILTTDTFYNIVATYDASTAKCYVNSTQTSQSASATSLFTSSNTTLEINRLDPNLGRYTNSNTYSVQVYNRALTAAEILQNYNALAIRYYGLSSAMTTNVFAPYDPVYDEFGGTLFGPGQGRYMRQNTDKSVIVYNEIDEVSDFRDIVRSGLVLDLDAGMNSSYSGSGTTWTDLSASGNNGTLTNGPTYSSANGGSIVFDGVDDFINCGTNTVLNVGNNITANAWFYVNSTSVYQPIVSKVVSDGSLGWEMSNSAGTFRLTFRPSATQLNLIAGSLVVGNWYMGTLTYDNTIARLYLNGVQTGSTTTGGPVTLNSTQPLQIGTRGIPSNWYNGNISQISIYNRALTSTEIQQNYNALRNRYGL